MRFSIIIPAKNEEKLIEKTVLSYKNYLESNLKAHKFDFLIVVNNSNDNTLEIAKRLSKKYLNIKFLDKKEPGKGLAILAGFKYFLSKNTEFIGFVDADESTYKESLLNLVGACKGQDCVIGSRYIKESKILSKQNLFRRITSRSLNLIIRKTFGINSKDTQCGAKFFSKKTLKKVYPEIETKKWLFDLDILLLYKKHKFNIKEVPVIWINRRKSKMSLKDSISVFKELVRLYEKNK